MVLVGQWSCDGLVHRSGDRSRRRRGHHHCSLRFRQCNGSGYKGRLALFELLVFDDAMRELVISQSSTAVLRAEARKHGMRTLRESGLLSIYDGRTTIDEVLRETIIEE